MKPTKKRVRQSIERLRKLIDDEKTPELEKRIAYGIETALRWSIEDTVGWTPPERDVFETASFIRRDARAQEGRGT